MSGDDIDDLVTPLRNGSKYAFEKIFNLYHQRIYNFCLRLLGNQDEAEETVQIVFVALWEQQLQLDETKPIASYLYSIARYSIYQVFRKRVYRKAAFKKIENSEVSFRDVFKDEILFQELSDVLQKLIEQLPARQKEIFRLSRDSCLSYKEIALKLGITENTVDTQIRRALDYLRREYEKQYKTS